LYSKRIELRGNNRPDGRNCDAFEACTGSCYWTGLDTFQFNGTVWYEADFRNHENASLRLQCEADGVMMAIASFLAPPSKVTAVAAGISGVL